MAEKRVGSNGAYRGQNPRRQWLAGEEGGGGRKVCRVQRRRVLPSELHVHGLRRAPTPHSSLGRDITVCMASRRGWVGCDLLEAAQPVRVK